MDPDGVFVFDMNTVYKHTNVLKNERFDFIDDEADCHWQNTLYTDENRTKISITINDKHAKQQYSEEFYEYYYPLQQVLDMLKKAGLEVKKLIDGESFGEIKDDTQRYMFMIKKEQNNG